MPSGPDARGERRHLHPQPRPHPVETALAQARAVDGDVLVVDNASTDGTPTVLTALARDAGDRLRVVREPRLGLSAARNRALAETAAPLVVFLDDDAVPRPGWLAALVAAHADERVVCAGGPIRLSFPAPPPAWLVPELHSTLTAYDLGTSARRLHDCPGWDYPYGANVSFRTDAARAAGGFSPRFGHRGRRQLQHEETDLCMRLDRAGGDIRYVPEAVVDHWVLAERLTPEFFLARHAQRGRSGAICEVLNRGWRPALKRLRWWDGPHLLVAPYRPRAPIDPQRLVAECRRREAVGYVLGLARALVLAPSRTGAATP
jgi:glycosyltransferase involved in cell wall biosynthesis